MFPRSAVLVVPAFLISALTSAEVDYRVVIPGADGPDQSMQVSLTFPVKSEITELQIPNWGPGGYSYGDFYRNVRDIKVAGDGKELKLDHPNDYTWSVATRGIKSVSVSYTVPVAITEGMGHYGGPRTYLYVVGRTQESCGLVIETPGGWQVATGLDTPSGPLDRSAAFYTGQIVAKHPFKAPTYDVLADNPVTFGHYRQLYYSVDGIPHLIAMYGPARNDVDTDKLIRACSYISAAENDFFGGKPPYTHYIWHFNVGKRPDGGGGLEHLASTEITLANGLGDGIIGVNAHEFFHLWNVKRIRARVLGPFDYTKLPETGALWWLEGVTEYYAHQLLTRYGYFDLNHWYATIASNYARVENNPAHLTVGPYEASFRVKDTNNGRGNSNGYEISYYDLGVLAGVCLDIEILSQSKGKFSLDDVEHALWNECKNNQPGFPEDEIRKQCVKFGGPALGEMYDRIIMRGGEMPIEQQLSKVGLAVETSDKVFPDPGFDQRLGRGMTISRVTTPGEGKLQTGDALVEVDGNAVPTGGALSAALGKIKPGDAVTLKVKRGEETIDISLTAGSVTRKVTEVSENPAATDAQRSLRDIWNYRGKKGWQPPNR